MLLTVLLVDEVVTYRYYKTASVRRIGQDSCKEAVL